MDGNYLRGKTCKSDVTTRVDWPQPLRWTSSSAPWSQSTFKETPSAKRSKQYPKSLPQPVTPSVRSSSWVLFFQLPSSMLWYRSWEELRLTCTSSYPADKTAVYHSVSTSCFITPAELLLREGHSERNLKFFQCAWFEHHDPNVTIQLIRSQLLINRI